MLHWELHKFRLVPGFSKLNKWLWTYAISEVSVEDNLKINLLHLQQTFLFYPRSDILYINKMKAICNRWGYSSVVEHSTADREVPGSIPGVPYTVLSVNFYNYIALSSFYMPEKF